MNRSHRESRWDRSSETSPVKRRRTSLFAVLALVLIPRALRDGAGAILEGVLFLALTFSLILSGFAETQVGQFLLLPLAIGGVILAGISIYRGVAEQLRAHTTARYAAIDRMLAQTDLNEWSANVLRMDLDRVGEADTDSIAFLVRWQHVEEGLRDLGTIELNVSADEAHRYPVGQLLTLLIQADALTPQAYRSIQLGSVVRDRVVHDGDADLAELSRASDQLAKVGKEIESALHGGQGSTGSRQV